MADLCLDCGINGVRRPKPCPIHDTKAESMTDRSDCTTADSVPPQIVERADDPPGALTAFIGQELEAWGFNVDSILDHDLHIECGGIALKVNVDWADDS